MKRKKLIINAIIVTFTTLIFGFIGMGFRVYVSNIIGSEGMGLLQLIMSIYVMASTISISGIRITVTRLVAEEIGKNNRLRAYSVVKKAFIYSLMFSLTTSVLLFYFAEAISINWLNDTRAIIPLKILSYALPCMGISACLNGYFYGIRKVYKSLTAETLEGLCNMLIVFICIHTLKSSDIKTASLVAALAMAVSQILATLFSYILYIFDKKITLKRLSKTSTTNYKFIDVLYVALPIAWSAYIQTALRTVENILIPIALRSFSSSSSSSLSIFGTIKGMVIPILNFPAIFLSSFATLIIPEIAEAKALNKNKMVTYITSKVFKFTLLLSIFSLGIFLSFSNEIGFALYKNKESGVLMRILAPLIPLMYLDRIVDAMLNALNHQVSTLKYNLIDMSTKILLIYYLIPLKGIEGFLTVIFISTILNSSLSINKLVKVTKLDFKILDWVIKPFICVLAGNLLINYAFDISVYIKIVISLFIYLFLLILSRCIKISDIKWFTDSFSDKECINAQNPSLYNENYTKSHIYFE